MDLTEKVFRIIQNTPDLWSKWNDAKTEHDRTILYVQTAYNLGYSDGGSAQVEWQDYLDRYDD
jgi:hypothetical protein